MNRFDRQDQLNHPRPAPNDFSRLVEPALRRRRFLGVSAAALGLGGLLGVAAPLRAQAKPAWRSPRMGFQSVAASGADTITLPPGYRWHTVASWGDPILAGGQPFDQDTRGSAASQALAIGDNNDAMAFYPLGAEHGLIVSNNEYTNYEYLFAHGKCASLEDVRKAQAAHGVALFEVRRRAGRWQVQPGARLNRRITANTPMLISGPVAGHPLMRTEADARGRLALGTFNNCAAGLTPWGTYLTCEENFNGYFGSASELKPTAAQKRYGLGARDAGYGWHAFDERFDLARHPNEAHRFGWVVEIDPMDPNSTPVKRTALGRFKHENAELVVNADGRVVVYMGDDERGEHLYKFVSAGRFRAGQPQANRHLLDEGTLYVARFDAEAGMLRGTGQWIELSWGKNGLTPENGFADQATVLLHARLAATQVGATTMDRPEWVAAHPGGRQLYVTLTNNKHRGSKPDQPVGGPNPRAGNPYGQILRWEPTAGDHGADSFAWDLFVIAGNPGQHPDSLMRGSPNVNTDNLFNSPDGLAFDADGRMWIQTDGNTSNAGDFAGMGNNQMLCGNPVTGEIRRFLVGPVACEITGLAFTPDQRTMFVGVQHPGEELQPSHFPDGGHSVPRSSIVAITRSDGGVIGA